MPARSGALFGIDRSGPLAARRRARARRCTRGRSRTWSATCAWRRSRSSSCSPSTPATGARPAPALIYLGITAGDYLDGFLARATGQYSRMGALLDPVVDRLTVLAGAAVCWHFELLPRWALAVARGARGGDPGARPGGAAARDRHRDQLDRADRRLPGLRRRSSGAWSSTGGSSGPASWSGSRSRVLATVIYVRDAGRSPAQRSSCNRQAQLEVCGAAYNRVQPGLRPGNATTG